MGSTYWLQVEISNEYAEKMANYDLTASVDYLVGSGSVSGSSKTASK